MLLKSTLDRPTELFFKALDQFVFGVTSRFNSDLTKKFLKTSNMPNVIRPCTGLLKIHVMRQHQKGLVC